MAAQEFAKTMYQRVLRSMRFDKSVYNEVKNDPTATIQSVLMPFIIWIGLIIGAVITVLPLLLSGSALNIGGNSLQIVAVIGLFVLISISFIFVPFVIWILVLILMGRFIGSKDLQAVEILRSTGFALSQAFSFGAVFAGIVYAAVLGGDFEVTVIALGGFLIVLFLIFISNVLAFREVTNVTTGVSVLTNIFALIVFGIIFAVIAFIFGLAIA